MNVELINASENPEQLVATAARNDYRSDGIIGDSFDDVMDSIEPKESYLENSDYDALTQMPEQARLEAKQRTLIDHLMRSGHWGPFEHPQATIAVEGATRVMMAQITRHRHFTFDIMSLRYVDVDGGPRDVCAVPQVEDLEVSRDGVHDDFVPQNVQQRMAESYRQSITDYRQLVDDGVPAEEARKVLPMGTKVNIVMSGNARAWMHILKVRTKADVQGETRRAAEAIFNELENWMPYVFEQYDEMLPMELGP